jgi:hypothetical protein
MPKRKVKKKLRAATPEMEDVVSSPTADSSNAIAKKSEAEPGSEGSPKQKTLRIQVPPSPVNPEGSPTASPSNAVSKKASPPQSKSDERSPIASPSNAVSKKASPSQSKSITFRVPTISSDEGSPTASPSKAVGKKASPPQSKSDEGIPIAGPSKAVGKKASPPQSKSDEGSPIAGPSNAVSKKASTPQSKSDEGSPTASPSKAVSKKAFPPRESTPDDPGSHPNSSSALVRLNKSPKDGKSSARRERVVPEYYIDPYSNWPPGWSPERKRKTNPLQWPLDVDDWAKFYNLCELMVAADSPKAFDIVEMIVEIGIWDVSHPAWSYKQLSAYFHPDKVQALLVISRSLGADLSDGRIKATHTISSKAYKSKLVNRFRIARVLTVAKIAKLPCKKSAKRLPK